VVHKKYTKRNGKLYGPYLYESKRVDGKVVTRYVGKGDVRETGAISRRKLFVLGIFILIVALIVLGVFSKVFISGTVALDVKTQYQEGEVLDGTFKLNVKEGELVPIESKIVINSGGVVNEFDLFSVVNENTVDGDFYVEGKGLSGRGGGFGVVGHKTVYPEVEFELLVYGEGADSEDSSSLEESEEEEDDSSDSGEEVVEDVGGAGEDVFETTEGESEQQSGVVEEESGPVVEESSESDSEESSDELGSVTGLSVSEGGMVILGSVKSGEDFVYLLEEEQDAEVVSGSVKVNGELVSDSEISFDVVGSEVIVSTDYSVEEKGFGKEYLGDVALSLVVDISKFDVPASSGVLSFEVVYDEEVLVFYEEEIMVEGKTAPIEEPQSEMEQQSIESNVITENATMEEALSSNVSVDISTTRSQIKIGEKVRWVKEVSLDASDDVTILLPGKAKNVVVKKKEGGNLESFSATVRTAVRSKITGQLMLEVDLEKEPWFVKWFKKLFGISGRAVDGEIENDMEKVIEVVLDRDSVEYVVEYETDAPEAFEEETDFGKRIVISGPDELDYTDVISFTDVPEVFEVGQENLIKVLWVDEGVYVRFDAYDKDGNDMLDYVEWITPHLSNQTFEIIFITKAEHLNENRDLIGDIYGEVKGRDGVWSEEILDGHYVRVMFERKLDFSKDITIYARSSNGGGVEVYEKDGIEKIADFGAIGADEEYKVLLDGLVGEQDVFDLKIVGGSVEFDWIVDPLESLYSGSNAQSGGLTITNSANANGPTTGNFASATAADNKWAQDSRYWYFVMDDSSLGTETINSVTLYLKHYQGGHVDDNYNIDVYDGTTWNTVQSYDGVSPPTTDTTNNWDVSAILNTLTKINAAQVRIAGAGKSGGGDAVTWYVDTVELRIDYTVLDNTLPLVQFVAPTDSNGSFLNRNFILANVTASDDFLDTISVRLFNLSGLVQQNTSSTSPLYVNFNNLIDGTYYLNASANDTSGNENYTETREIFLDTTAPNVNINSPLNIDYGINVIEFNVSLNEYGFCVYSLDGGPNNSMSTIDNLNFFDVNTSVTEGSHVVRFYCNDTLGNLNDSESVVFNIDNSEPIFNESEGRPQPGSQFNQADAVDLVVSLNENASVLVNVSWDVVSEVVSLDYNGTTWYFNDTFVNTFFPGDYFIVANATDNVGNSNVSYSNFSVNDVTNPSVRNITPTRGSVFGIGQEVNITVNVTDAYYDSVDSVIVDVRSPDGGYTNHSLTEVGNTQRFEFLFGNTVLLGIYNLTIFANDTSGNVNNTETSWFEVLFIDAVAPSVTLNYPEEGFNLSFGNINFNWTAIDSFDVVLECNLTIDGAINVSGVVSANGSAINYSIGGFAEGTHYWNVTCVDDANNTGVSETRTFNVDRTSPVIVIDSPLNKTYKIKSIDLNVSADEYIEEWKYSLNGGDNVSFVPNLSIIGIEGTNTIVVYARDIVGNINSSSVVFSVDTISPNITSTTIDPYDPYVGQNVFLNMSAVPNAGALSGKFAEIVLPNGSAVVLPLSAEYNAGLTGRHNVTFFANDTAGNVAALEDYFVAGSTREEVQFNAVDKNLAGIPVNLTLYFSGSDKEIHLHKFNGIYLDNYTNILYDLLFEGLGGNISVRLNDVNLSIDNNGTIGFDRTKLSGFLVVYAVNSSYGISNANLIIDYSRTGFSDEDLLRVYVCDNWDFIGRSCLGSFALTSAVQNVNNDKFELNVSGFSAFAIRQEDEEVIEEEEEVRRRGGGGEFVEKLVVVRDTFLWDVLDIGKEINISIGRSGCFDMVSFVQSEKTVGGRLSLIQKAMADILGGKVYYGCDVNSEGLIFDEATIRFSVDRVWIETNEIDERAVYLYKFDEEWKRLPTFVESEEENIIKYYAVTDGFSDFVIVGFKKVAFGERIRRMSVTNLILIIISIVLLLILWYICVREKKQERKGKGKSKLEEQGIQKYLNKIGVDKIW